VRRVFALWIAGWVVASPLAPAVAGPGHGAQIAATCAACHRLDGRGAGTTPIIGFSADRLVGMMRAFRSNDTPNHIMHAVSLSLSDDDIAAVAQYLAALEKDAKQP
jgi:sulfide dehydrogenase cytochrome subunit